MGWLVHITVKRSSLSDLFQTFAQGVVNFEPIDKILNASEITQAKSLLQTKPPSISEDLFRVIQNQVLNGTPQVEYLLVRLHFSHLSRSNCF